MPANTLGKAFDIERRGRNIEPFVEGAAVLKFGPVDHPDDGLDVIEVRLPWVAPVGLDPVDDR